MLRGNGSPKFNGIAVGELEINLLGPAIHIKSTYALTNVDNGDRFGRGVKEGNWSPETIQVFLSFVAAMENDICNDVFDGGSTTETPIETDEQGIKSL
jgi:hypothetical protein